MGAKQTLTLKSAQHRTPMDDHELLPHYQALRENKSWRTILELDQHTAINERIIKKQFRRLSLKWHPGKPSGDKEIFQIILTASQILPKEMQVQQEIARIVELLDGGRWYEVFGASPSTDVHRIQSSYDDAWARCGAEEEVGNLHHLRNLLTFAWERIVYLHNCRQQEIANEEARKARAKEEARKVQAEQETSKARFKDQRQKSDANSWCQPKTARDKEKDQKDKEDLRQQIKIIKAQQARLVADAEKRRQEDLRRDERQRKEDLYNRRLRQQAEKRRQEDLRRNERQHQEDLNRRLQAERQRQEDLYNRHLRREREERRHKLHVRAQEQQDREEAEDQREAEERKMAEEQSQRQALHPAPASAPTYVNPTPPTSPNQVPENQGATSSSDKERTGPQGRGTRAGTGRRRSKRKNVDPHDLVLNIMGSDAEEESEHAVGSEEDDSTLTAKKPEPCTMWQAAGCRRGETCPYGHVGEGRLISKSEARRRDRRRKWSP